MYFITLLKFSFYFSNLEKKKKFIAICNYICCAIFGLIKLSEVE